MDLGGRATNSLLRISDPVANDRRWIISNRKVFKTYSRWSWHIIVLHGRMSEGIINRMACGSCNIFNHCSQRPYEKNTFSALATP